MRNIKKTGILSFFFAAIIVSFFASLASSEDVKKISKEELKDLLGQSNVSILDVRRGKDWSSSEFKIKGAQRADGNDFSSWADTYPKENKIILYCA